MFSWEWVFLYIFIVHQTVTFIGSVYLHRGHTHRSLDVNYNMQLVCRFFAWLAGFWWPQWEKQWAAIHRKHHMHSDTEEDPHSPHFKSFWQLLDNRGSNPEHTYYISNEDQDKWAGDVTVFSDWAEKNIYHRYPTQGPYILYAIALILYGWIGLIIFFIAQKILRKYGVLHNYFSHKIGFKYEKNLNKNDKSVNIFPIGLFWAGEELAANHHNDPSSAKFSKRWWEFDPSWMYIRIFVFLGLIKLKNPAKYQ